MTYLFDPWWVTDRCRVMDGDAFLGKSPREGRASRSFRTIRYHTSPDTGWFTWRRGYGKKTTPRTHPIAHFYSPARRAPSPVLLIDNQGFEHHNYLKLLDYVPRCAPLGNTGVTLWRIVDAQ